MYVHNAGSQPTYVTEAAREAGIAKPVVAAIALGDGGTLVSGDREAELGHLEGRANAIAEISWSDVYPVLNQAKAEWIVRQPASSAVTLTARCPKAGVARADITLG